MESQPYKVELRNVTKTFESKKGTVSAIDNVEMQISPHKFVSIIGPSGCGKSTLFNIISGLDEPSDGELVIDGMNVNGSTGLVGYMLQKDLLLPWRSILDNVILGMEILKKPKNEAKDIALPLLEKYGLKGFEHSYPSQLSGGMRQRAALLRTVLYNKDIILLDEPFGALDAQTRANMQEWLLDLWDDFQKTILFVTHDIDEAIYLSDEIYIMTARPGTVKCRLKVDLARPRKPTITTSKEFIRLKEEALHLLSQEVKKSQKEGA
ncbi:ABC transporter ATP-binding protein [Alkalicoccobacillus murimartini]|uniref:ABC-type nitrate/sulfonate/bicarbonate transport system ATPase subunit n=1 Tax=Alkalicoccobacillus murimartini TaxID=171685 RepID=A0ABT9YJG7_9BACI|nr:ABC transporter ATP-binding protein [Alkalicoccobacillus murimartini]MDQ0207357.1 ABC-type nitrate/sulfonate/bicarbonate transport system ATPase subunit [Alkalicoccobacillus murimartini]